MILILPSQSEVRTMRKEGIHKWALLQISHFREVLDLPLWSPLRLAMVMSSDFNEKEMWRHSQDSFSPIIIIFLFIQSKEM